MANCSIKVSAATPITRRWHSCSKRWPDLYSCDCNRQRVAELGGIYDGHAVVTRQSWHGSAARLRLPATGRDAQNGRIVFDDLIMGRYEQNLCCDVGDFVVKRRDGLISYQLAVTVDDQFQGISHIVRGADLLELDAQAALSCNAASALVAAVSPLRRQSSMATYHLAANAEGQKLSKQNHAAAAALRASEVDPASVAGPRLAATGASRIELAQRERGQHMLGWAIANWVLGNMPAQMALPAGQDV